MCRKKNENGELRDKKLIIKDEATETVHRNKNSVKLKYQDLSCIKVKK